MTNSTHLAKSGLFVKKSHQPSFMARNLKMQLYHKSGAFADPRLYFVVAVVKKNIVHQVGHFQPPSPHPLLLNLFISLEKTDILPNVFHNWSLLKGFSDKSYPPSKERLF